jgi:cold shock CspA family protein
MRLQTIYVDAGYKQGVGGHISWFNATTGKTFYEKRDCTNSFLCEYDAILRAVQDHATTINEGNEVEFLIDNQAVQKQLNKQNGINDDKARQKALKIWETVAGKNVRFQYVPREQNKAGKILGS